MLDKIFQRGYFIRICCTGFRFNNSMRPNMLSVFNRNSICRFSKVLHIGFTSISQ